MVFAGLVAVPAAAEIVVHEFVAPGASIVSMIGRGGSDSLAAAAPMPTQAPSNEHVYRDKQGEGPLAERYAGDRTTTDPGPQAYEDPFTPTMTPYKRLYALDALAEDGALVVASSTLRPVPVGRSLGRDEDSIVADFWVELRASEPVRIPSVGADAHIVRLRTVPPTDVNVQRDSADNWFLVSRETKRVRILMDLGLDRAGLGPIPAVFSQTQLSSMAVPVPLGLRGELAVALPSMGIDETTAPAQAVRRMVSFFRSFAAADAPLEPRRSTFLDLVSSKQGVCRHRAYAFVVAALLQQIPARFVANEAHAWVEVFTGTRWHRIDLGGASSPVLSRDEKQRPAYRNPKDAYGWPRVNDGGTERAEAARSGGPGQPTQAPGDTDAGADGTPGAPSAPGAQVQEHPSVEQSIIRVDAISNRADRGTLFPVRGSVFGPKGPCSFVRVDLWLARDGEEELHLASLVTDELGIFQGSPSVPHDVALGKYDLVLATPGNGECGPGSAR